MASDVAMETSPPDPAEATEPPPAEGPPAEPPQPEEPPVAEPVPKRRQRKPRPAVVTDAQPREAKRPNRRVQTPPSIAVDHNFWSGLLATQRALRRESKTQRYSNLAIV